MFRTTNYNSISIIISKGMLFMLNDSIQNMDKTLYDLLKGNTLMILCSLFYLLWWMIAFWPKNQHHTPFTAFLLILAFVAGIASLFIIIPAINHANNTQQLYPSKVLYFVGIIVYIVLAIFSWCVLKRQVTTELLLIVGWSVLQFSILNVFYGNNVIGSTMGILLCVLIVVIAVASLACYLAYYRLKPVPSYLVGMIPLLLVTVMMVGEVVFLTTKVTLIK